MPYRSHYVEGEKRVAEPGIVADMVRQFADKHAFLRELVQNGIDAGATRIDVRIDRDEGGIVRTSVADDGAGMPRAVIEGPLITLFSSSKENDKSKIGKYGIGFISVFALEPDSVEVRTFTASEGWLLRLFGDHTWELSAARRGPDDRNGTSVTLVQPMAVEAFLAHVAASARALSRWCRHARIPIDLLVLDAGDPAATRTVSIQEPFAAPGLVSVAWEEDGERIVASAGPPPANAPTSDGGGPPFIGYYNRGLTLFETTALDRDFGGLRLKIDSPRLSHTLSRDDIVRDGELKRLHHRALELVRRQLCRAVHVHAAGAAAGAITPSEYLPYVEAAAVVALAFARAEGKLAVPLVEPIDKQNTLTVHDLLKTCGDTILVAAAPSPLTRALARQGRAVVRWIECAAPLNAFVNGVDIDDASRVIAYAGPVAERHPEDDALEAAVADVLRKIGRSVGRAMLAAFAGARADQPFRVGATDANESAIVAPQTSERPWGRHATAFLNVENAGVRLARRRAKTDPVVAAHLLCRALLVADGPLDAKTVDRFLEAALESDPVVARGRIKVDARKALDKLRDHMLVDPHLWACEVARVAIALGATRLDVEWSGDDFILEFDGRALPALSIARARDHVLTPLDGTEGDALRSLGIGIGAALSLGPAFIDVISSGADADGPRRVRFERTYIDEDAEAAVPEPVPVDAPTLLTTRVQVRHRLGIDSIGRALWAETPPEVALLEEHIDLRRIALSVRNGPRRTPVVPVLSVDLDVPGTTHAALEILDGNDLRSPTVEFFENGVRLATLPTASLWGLTRLPVRVVVDAPRLPTNASRSQIRHDADLTRRVFDRVLPVFAIAIAALRGEKAKTFGHVVTTHGDEDAFANAFGAIVAEAARAARANEAIANEARALLDAPVVYDAIGRVIPLSALRGGLPGAPLRVYTGAEALPAELAPWLDGVLWQRGLAAERAVAELAMTSADELVLPARRALERRERALMHAASPPVVTPSEETLHRESFTIENGPFAGLSGEIAIVKPHAQRGRLATARLFVDERALETVTLPGVRLPVELALAWPRRVVARFEYDAVDRNEHLARALHVGLRLAALAIGSHFPDRDDALVRLAIGAWAEATRALGDGERLGELAAAPVWRTNDGRLVSFAVIEAYAILTGTICFATTSKAPAPDGRVVLTRVEVDALRPLLPEKTIFVAYDEALNARNELPETTTSVAVAIDHGALQGWIVPGTGRLRVYHAGVRIRNEPWKSSYGPVDVVLVDRAAVPKPAQEQGAYWCSPLGDSREAETLLVDRVVTACEKDEIELSTVEAYLNLSATLLEWPLLTARISLLPVRRDDLRRARLKREVMERAPIDLAARVGDATRGSATTKKGAVGVVLPTGLSKPAELFFAGHPLGTMPLGFLPVDAFIDVVDESFVREWEGLSTAGVAWAEPALVDAALNLVDKLAASDAVADDVAALTLLTALLVESPARAGAVFQRVCWPTVQGRLVKLGDVVKVRVGGHRYDPWRSFGDPSPYDTAAIHLPITNVGEARRRTLAAAGVLLEDVTEPVARLQALRARGAQTAPPKLDGEPAHPLLRASLGQLGATLMEGEIELADADWSAVATVNAAGVRESAPLALSYPMRVVYRAEGDWFAGLDRELQQAARQLLLNLAPHLDELPIFVRKHLRRLVCADLAAVDEHAAVFPSTAGRWLSLAVVRELPDELAFTTGAPPYPPEDQVVLRLDETEAAALARIRSMWNVTERLQKIQRGLERRAAPPREAIVLDDDTRAKCMFVAQVDEEGIRGEIGFLYPTHTLLRRIDLFQTMRPLVTIADPEGWPVVAMLNDDALAPDVGFEALADPKKDAVRIHHLIRRLVGPNVNAFLKAPPLTVGVVRLPTPFLIRALKGQPRIAAAIGVLWLPKEWPERPTVHVEAVGITAADRLPTIPASPDVHSRIVPVCGRIWITADARALPEALEHVMAWVSLRLAAHVRAANMPDADAYRWDLALLGVLDEPGTDPIKELKSDRPAPDLMRVVARRAPQLVDRAIGDKPAAALPMDVQDVAAEKAPDPAVVVPLPAPESFFAGLVRRVVELVAPAPPVAAASPLMTAIADALRAMSLTGDPVLGVRSTRRGRPVSYDRATGQVLVNEAHPTVRAHAERPNGTLFLVVAALSEINRELVEVTDAEELAKLFDLLRANAANA